MLMLLTLIIHLFSDDKFTSFCQEVSDFLQLQGECKIISVKYVKFSHLKTCLLIIPVILSIIGLFMLKYYKWFRIKVFYAHAEFQTASHIYIFGSNKSEQIQELFQRQQTKIFTYQQLRYKIVDYRPIPIGLNLKRFYNEHICNDYLSYGLSKEQYENNLERYGRNEHLVHPPNYFEYVFKTMTQPFFLIQYLAAGIYLAQKVTTLAVLLLSASLITVTINYILLYYSYKKIKQMAQKQIKLNVIRNGEKLQILQAQIVPGDIYEPLNEIPCDSLLLQGQVYVNQASLTGESIPIGKFAIKKVSQVKQSNKWLYQGSHVISSRLSTLALAVHTGYTSRRGRIIRKILHKNPKEPQFFKTFIYFLTETYIIGGIIIYFATLKYFIDAQIETAMIVLLFFLYITFCYPPAFPIYFNLAYSYSLARLKFKNIHGTEPQKTVQGTNLQIMCFDKTGTLTQQKVILHKIYKYFDKYIHKDITEKLDEKQNRIEKMIFSCCHTVKQIEEKLHGDQVDLRMFSHTKCKMTSCDQQQVLQDIVCTQHNQQFSVLKINQYESRFQSMSVMVRDKQTKKYYILVKGAPQKIHKSSTLQIEGFSPLIKELSYGGFRTIAFGYKQIKQKQYSHYMKASRQQFLQNIRLTGVVAFENKLKDDAIQTINSLHKAQIQPKMITGDNIFIAIQTAARAQIINKNEQIGVIEGLLQNRYKNEKIYHVKIVSNIDNQFHMRQLQMQHSQFLNTKLSLAVDNDFLELQPAPLLIHQIKIYSRISPQNKAKIVRTLKEQIKLKHKSQSFIKRTFGKGVQTVGMVGDGANDLIAIKQADIGLGISNSDASYAASFSINNLMDVDEIVRESKCTERSIMQICRFFSITGFLNIIQFSVLFTQGSFFSQAQLGYANFTRLIVVSIVIALSRPSKQTTKYRPCSNFMGLQNHLVYWGNVIIYSLGFIFVYFYGRDYSGQFIPNPKPHVTFADGYYSKTFSVTLQFLIFCMQPQTLIFYVYKSKPWKQRIWKNILLFLIIIINMGLGIAGFFLTSQLASFLDLVPLSKKVQITVFIVSMVMIIMAFIYNLIIDCLKFHQRQYQQLSEYNQNNDHLNHNAPETNFQLAIQTQI